MLIILLVIQPENKLDLYKRQESHTRHSTTEIYNYTSKENFVNQRHFELGGCDSGPEMFSSAFSNTHLVEAEILSMASKHAGMDWDNNVYEQLFTCWKR